MKKNFKKRENMISFVFQFRNKLNAMFGDDPDFTIYEVDEPLPDGTTEYYDDGRVLNIVSSNVIKLTLLRDYLGDEFEDGEKLHIDYYFGRPNTNHSYVNIDNRPSTNARLDIAMLFEGNPHFSKFYSGYGIAGPWYCVAFKPELIQYYTESTIALHGRRSCAMEDIARELFPEVAHNKIYFSTENIEDFEKSTVLKVTAGGSPLYSVQYTPSICTCSNLGNTTYTCSNTSL